MSKEVGNADWIAREEGRIPTKGAKAAQRASAGLGATDHDAEILEEQLVLGRIRPRQIPTPERPAQDKS
jgi:hypothetical protein